MSKKPHIYKVRLVPFVRLGVTWWFTVKRKSDDIDLLTKGSWWKNAPEHMLFKTASANRKQAIEEIEKKFKHLKVVDD